MFGTLARLVSGREKGAKLPRQAERALLHKGLSAPVVEFDDGAESAFAGREIHRGGGVHHRMGEQRLFHARKRDPLAVDLDDAVPASREAEFLSDALHRVAGRDGPSVAREGRDHAQGSVLRGLYRDVAEGRP